jgi:hypothetical protein
VVGKGHKQRGAGSVLISKGPVETKSGVLKKEWQRMPTQLLAEWAQREKRPRPQYMRARIRGKGGAKKADEDEEDEEDWTKYLSGPPAEEQAPTEWRQRVVLADAKYADRSLSFCPSEASPTEELAREHAALLALLQVAAIKQNTHKQAPHISFPISLLSQRFRHQNWIGSDHQLRLQT